MSHEVVPSFVMKYILPLVCLFGLGCATTSIPTSTTPADLSEIGDRWSLHVVTLDPDGDERVTRVWIALVDGQPAIRTNDSRWWQNLEREPTIRVRSAGVDHPFRTESVTELADRTRIDDAFLSKYGAWEKMLFPQERGHTHDNFALLVE